MDFLEEELTSQDPCLIFPAKDWFIFYNQIWRDLNGVGEKIWYFFKWDGATPDEWYSVSKPSDNMSISNCWNKTLHDQNYVKLVNKHCEESEMDFLSQSSDGSNSDEWDRDWPIAEHNPFECCKRSLYFEWSDIPVLHNIFLTIDKLFHLSWNHFTMIL